MGRSQPVTWPQRIAVGNVVVKVYRNAAPRAKTGWEYTLAWQTEAGRQRKAFADQSVALAEARLKAEQIDSGQVQAAGMSREDRDELVTLREIAGAVPPVVALKEWARARELTQGHVVPAAEAWAARNGRSSRDRITVGQAIDRYMAAREADGINVLRGAGRTFAVKRQSVVDRSFRAVLGHAPLADVTPNQIAEWLANHPHAVSRNTHRKRIVALFRWSRRRGYLPLDVMTAAERTDRAREPSEQIGLVTADELRRAFGLIAAKQPKYVPALAVAAFCGLRRSEVHGQLWEDVDFERQTLRVSAAKPNTPARRVVPLCDPAPAWLAPYRQENGRLCANLTMDRIRDICRTADPRLDLADNGFRHSWISARVELSGDIPRTSIEAGNTPRVIHRHYLELMRREDAEAWFSVTPAA